MECDIPTDLINNSQILFRQLAGLESYNPNLNPNFQSLPSIESFISTPDHVKCNYCHGNLLRGLNSLICIYCGQFPNNNNNNNDFISFNSTHGYTWLLQSLNFNGSERVGSLVEGSGINGGQSPAEDEATICELLDLKITRPKKSDNKISKHSSFVNVGTADVDNFFIESKRANVSHVVTEEINENKAFDDDSSGWNAEFQSADTEIVNETFKSVDPFVGAEVDLSSQMDVVFGPMESFNKKKPNDDLDLFPSDDPFANMRSENVQRAEPSDSVQANDGLSGNLNSHKSQSMDAVFGQMESFNNRIPNDDLDLFPSDDLFSNMSSGSFQQAEPLDSVVQANDGLSGHINSVDAVFGQMESLNSRKVNDDLDLFPPEDLFASTGAVSFQQAEQLDSIGQANDGLSGHLNDPNSKSVGADFGQIGIFYNKKPNDDLNLFPSDDPFANMSAESFQQAKQLDLVQANDSLSVNDLNSKSADQDWFNDDNWQKSGTNFINASSTEAVSVDWFENTSWQKSDTADTATSKDINLFDVKPLITSDPDNLYKHNAKDTSEPTDWFQDSQWSVGASSSTNIAVSKDNDDDGFDEWNDFTSSTGNQDSFPDSRKDSSNEKAVNENMPELNLFPSTANPQELDFGNFFQSADLFTGSASNKKPNDNQTEYDIFSEASTASRNANVEAGNSLEGQKNDEISRNTTTSSNDDVQMLMSQMHDLSFMLKSELSIPSKTDNLDS